ncbi:hypothetical protein [Modestobacter italicus]|uniref:hypothetical protein n=1 Tax=Modestobacter italicus (strain DSM 44449 / CECT 9708 / BC 501) TaxID=2732864 RepID=UPI001411B806|nr:hypothetical protein [Modestobacter marinus]
MSAPPGAGKTTLMAGWASDRAARGHRVAWVSLADQGDDPAAVWTSLLGALRVTAGRNGDETAAEARGGLPLAELAALVSGGGAPVWLFLDDVQAVSAPAVLTDLARLLRRLPEGLHVVLGTRRDPAVGLHLLRLTGRLREVRAADLALDRTRVQQVLAEHGVTLDGPSLDLLVDRTQGWAAGVRLAALALSRAADPRSLARDLGGDDREVADYLDAEVLQGLAPAERQLLRSCAVPEQLSADLAAALTGDPSAGALLDRLYRDNALVTRLERPSGCYRLHPLLRGHLLALLRRTAPGPAARGPPARRGLVRRHR